MDDLISVVVPAYNCAQWLPGCLDSLLVQTYGNLEIIVVNDGSTDGTDRVMEQYAKKDSRISCIHQENSGATAARLQGVGRAKGDWITFADGDDVLEPDMLAHLLYNAHQYQADISHCGFRELHPDGREVRLHGTGVRKLQDHDTGLRDLLAEELVEPSLCTKLFRRSLFQDLEQKLDRSLKNNEDMLMNYFLFDRAQQSVFEDVCLYRYLIHPGSASRRKLNDYLIYDSIRVRRIILEHCGAALKDDARRALVRMCLVSYRLLAMETEPEYKLHRKKVRQIIAEQLPYSGILPKRNALLVQLISRAPWVFDLLYPPFEKRFR